ncbi:MAG: glycosyltransferase [Endomicrobium sp.]|jgi:glycosyltransferase involved in cell wall biosynthesis|uniref:glycosyltransferase n=1 Tax=Candidatus Endomicrobiellum cubanum TaxID=3242325 RepID=UPI00281B797C|nr:glycosyltransferase [Endomicrobium sp.]
MKIAYIITSMGIGGAEVVTVDIANRMLDKGNEILILYLTGQNLNQHRINKGIEIVGLNMQKNLFSFVKSLLKAKKILKNFCPDVVHSNMYHANIFSRILRIFYRFKCLICSEHNCRIGIGIRHRIRLLFYQITQNLSDLDTNVSEEAVELFLKYKAFNKNTSLYMYNGIDLKKFYSNNNARKEIRKIYNIANSEFLFLNIGRLTLAKDQKSLIEAFSLLSQKHTNIKLMIIGNGDLEQELKNFAIEKNVNNLVIFTGNIKNVQDYYNASDVFVLSSAWEGFGIVIAEAMACALPVIATNAGGVREVLNDDQFIAPIKDSSALYKKMKYMYLLKNEERNKIGNKNLNRAKFFDIDSITSKWLNIYNERDKL